MYIGIYINESQIAAALLNQDDEVVPINGSAIATDNKSAATQLKIYIEDDFAYVDTPVDHLITNDYDLNCAKYFLDDLQHPEKTIYTDPTGVDWNAPMLLAIFLKKLKGDILVHNEGRIQGAMVTMTKAITPAVTDALKQAFELADIPFCGAVDLGKAAWFGSRIAESSPDDQKVLVYNLENRALSLSVIAIDNENFMDTLLLKSDKALGENAVHEDFMDFLAKTYHTMTGNKIKKTAKNAIALKKMAKDTLFDIFSQSELYFRTVYDMTEPAIELILTRAQMNAIISKYMQRSLSFLEEALQGAEITPRDIGTVVLTGESQLLSTVPSVFHKLFDPKKTSIHHQNPAEIITKGITLLANDAIEREINTSLISGKERVGKSKSDNKNGSASKKNKENNDMTEWIELIHSMQINRLGDM